jgi:predicted NUDIX family phosphoesterase
MKKEDELVWVFPDCLSKEFEDLPGISRNPMDWAYLVAEVLPQCVFMRRGDVEDDPSMQQVIPYIVGRHEDKVLVYNRGTSGAENRLADLFSIGIGGHINPVDAEDTLADEPLDVLLHASAREMSEELTADNTGLENYRLMFKALLKTDVTEVDAVHFGVVFEARFANLDGVDGSDEIDRVRWVTLEGLRNYNLESWSELVFEQVLLKEEEEDA